LCYIFLGLGCSPTHPRLELGQVRLIKPAPKHIHTLHRVVNNEVFYSELNCFIANIHTVPYVLVSANISAIMKLVILAS